VLRDRLVVHAIIGQQNGRRSLGHPLLRLPCPEQRLDLLPLCNTQLYRILWT
jgi:hypothetical protein